jgi:alpha-1,3-fucosyltransferase 10
MVLIVQPNTLVLCAAAAAVCRYKFCVAMENSIRQDYMTEKMWDALAAGCIPVYLGSSNAQHIVPDPTSFIV